MVKGIIFLSGGGNKEDSYLLDKEFAKYVKRKLLYIPIAIGTLEHPYNECFKWIKDVFKQFNFDNIEMWTDIRNKTIKDLKQFDAIYISGGNTFKLLKEIKDSRFDKLLIEFYNKEGHIYGGSAGAIILGKSIITASKNDKNEVKLKNLNGLNLCHGYSIWCHYNLKDDKEILVLQKRERLRKIAALSEDAGLIIENKEIKAIGDGHIFFF